MSFSFQPRVTVLMANYNSGRFITAALRSALSQTMQDLEVVVVDDASTDDSRENVRRIAAHDARVRLITSTVNRGPAAARNVGLDHARGHWIAIMDSDDLMHPDRLHILLEAAQSHQAGIVADNLLTFDETCTHAPTTLLKSNPGDPPRMIQLNAYIRSNTPFAPGPALGYLKPLIRSDLLGASGLRYNPDLRIAEDSDLIERLLINGNTFICVSDLTYFYRKHAASTSHRLTQDSLQSMQRAYKDLRASISLMPEDMKASFQQRERSIQKAIGFDALVTELKARRFWPILKTILQNPASVLLLRLPLMARLRKFHRIFQKTSDIKASSGKNILLISRQRLASGRNGSATYLLGLCKALKEHGYDIHLISPSPGTFGRWPFLHMGRDALVFASIHMRGAWKLGRIYLAYDPRTWFRGIASAVERHIPQWVRGGRSWIKPSPYAVAAPWACKDLLYIARQAQNRAAIILADYAFTAPAIPYALCPDAFSAIIMHDLFSSRAEHFKHVRTADSVARISLTDEIKLLSMANAIAAIQPDEADRVRHHLPNHQVFVAPMAVTPVRIPQPGITPRLLFVGSKTAPNIQGLTWFLEKIWPLILDGCPCAQLDIAGTVCDALHVQAPNINRAGRVNDLAFLYRTASVVISPLQAGSGLKIKLIEALGHGKAIVATSITAQGVRDTIQHAVLIADSADDFARSVLELLHDTDLRYHYAQQALLVAQAHFSSPSCYTDLYHFISSSNDSRRMPLCS